MSGNEQRLELSTEGPRWLQFARAAWPFPAAVAVGVLIASIPGYLRSPILSIFEGQLILEPGSPAFTLLRVTYVASFLSATVSLILALFLFLRRRAHPMGLFLSYYLLGHGILFAGSIELLYPYWEAAPWVNSFILLPLFGGPMTIALVALFPDGRFVPSWSRWLIPLSFLTVPASLLGANGQLRFALDFFPNSDAIAIAVLIVGSAALVITAIYVQVHRFRHVSTPTQKLQTKWVLYGLGLWLGVNVATSSGWTIALQLPAGAPVPVWLSLASLMWVSSSLLLPATLTISIMRFRLFEIDQIINRTLVYGALTLAVIAIYILVVAALGILFQTQGNLLIALVATAIVAVLFQPLRDRLQRGINRLIFGERGEPIETLSRLGSRLENALVPEQVLPTLVETIAQTLELPYVAIVMSAAEGERLAAAHGKASLEVTSLDLTYQGQGIGQLLVAPRAEGLAFSKSEMRLLQNIARQAGTAIRAAQLANDLRRSRQQIVTTREEERRRLRRDLHDGIGPAMAGQTLKLDAVLDLIAQASANGRTPELVEATHLLQSLKEGTQESIRSIRRIVYGLRPPALDDLGLIASVQAYVAQHSEAMKGLKVTITAPPEGLPSLPAAVEVAIYRIALEGLTNVIQHAHAQRCQIILSTAVNVSCEIRLEIVDDGIGLPAGYNGGVGLASMCERATELGGRFSIEPGQPTGTRILAAIPFATEGA